MSPILGPLTSQFTSFFVPPDGSKEGWDFSNQWDARRDAFVEWLRTYRHDAEDEEFNSNGLHWVEVQFADDDRETRIVRSSDEDWRERIKRTESEPKKL